nr:MAG TPA: hypothetical protein [Caudoviricetes sp.]
MRKYYITRKSAVTTCSVKAVNTTTFEVVDMSVAVDGAFPSNVEALKAITKSWENSEMNPIAVTGMTCKVQTRGMTMQNWFANADVISEEEITAEEAASFGKRSKKSDDQ